MSAWRREASLTLPEFQRIIVSRDVDNPMMLWIELNLEFPRLCSDLPGNLPLLRRIWRYGDWCLQQESREVQTAAALAFCEHLLDSPASTTALPQIMSRSDYLGLKSLLINHNSEDAFEVGLRRFTDSVFTV